MNVIKLKYLSLNGCYKNKNELLFLIFQYF